MNDLRPIQDTFGLSTPGQLLELIRMGRANTRSDLAALTGLARSTVSQRVDALIAHGLVYEAGEAPSSGGRPPVRLAFNNSAGVVLVADLGATQSSFGVVDLAGNVLSSRRHELSIAAGPDYVLGLANQRFEELLVEVGIEAGKVRAIGVGVPGPVEFKAGRTVAPPIMPGWDGVVIPDRFSEAFPTAPVLVDNDVNIMAIGEYWQVWREQVDDLLFIKVGTGIGAGIIIGGRIHRGADGTAGDIGHIRLADHPEVTCRCGNRGCVEALASGAALARQLTELGFKAETSRDVVAEVRAGNSLATRLVRDAGRMLGEVLAGAVNLFNPAVIVVGGDVAAADEQLFAGIREVVYERSTALATRHLQIVPSQLEGQAGLIGGAVMAIERVLAPDVVDAAIEAARTEQQK